MKKPKDRLVYLSLMTVVLLSVYSCKDEIPVAGIRVEPAEITLMEGEKAQLSVTVTPENATSEISVFNSDASIVEVNDGYEVIALKEGNALLTFESGNVSAECKVTVLTSEFGVVPAMDEIVFDAASPETIEFRITGNKKWTVDCDAEWCTVTETEGGFSVTAKQSAQMEDRTGGHLTVKPQSEDEPVVMPIRQNGLKIYLAGDDNNYAAYWLNGEKVAVSDSPATYLSGIYATKEGRVSVVGRSGTSRSLGFYWDKDKGLFTLNSKEESSGTAFSVFVDEASGDIYFTDHEGWMMDNYAPTYVARYWKNFVPTDLTEEGKVSQAGDIMFRNGNLYVIVQNGNDIYYLKNDEKIELESFNGDISPSSMCIVGDDVYIGGDYDAVNNFSPCYWKNGKINILTSSQDAQIYGITVDQEGNVYLAGSYGSGLTRAAAYWKNEEMTLLTDQTNCCLSGIAVVDGNIICGGTYTDPEGTSFATCWINGKEWKMNDAGTSCWVEAMFIR